ncbi:MAG: TetR/AcrR family transcriptional regulator [Ornithinimicrobium sp.]
MTEAVEVARNAGRQPGDKREVIVAAALRCFDREGFHRASMSMVIEEAGVSAGTVYRYFSSKTDLIRACAEEVLSEVHTTLGDMVVAQGTPDVQTIVTSFLRSALDAGSRHGADLTRVGVSVWAECLRDPVLCAHVRSLYLELRGGMVQIARRWQDEGLLADTDPEHVAQALFGAMPGFVVQHLVLGDVDPGGYAAGLEALGAVARGSD